MRGYMPWNAQRKLMFAKLVLCGVEFQKRGPHKHDGSGWEARTKWYVTLPPHAPTKSYVNGGYRSKSEAVDVAARYMEIEYEH